MEYFDYRVNQLWCLNRKDVSRAFEWVLTLPSTLTNKTDIETFWKGFIEYLAVLYGIQNVISVTTHHEEHKIHAHALILPVVKNNKQSKTRPQAEKISAKEVLTKDHLTTWHCGLEKFLLEKKGLSVTLRTGKTKAQGGNRNYYHDKKRGIKRNYDKNHWYDKRQQPERERGR